MWYYFNRYTKVSGKIKSKNKGLLNPLSLKDVWYIKSLVRVVINDVVVFRSQ